MEIVDKLDANESVFFKRELEYIKSKLYDKKYKRIRYADFIPVSTEADNTANQITWRSFSKIGRAKIISNYATDFPRSDAYGIENTSGVRSLGASYGYNIIEIRRSQKTGKRLDTRRAENARESIEILLNELAWSGDSTYNIQGLINYPGITLYSVPAGAATTKTWATKTQLEILSDMFGIVNAIVTSTNMVEAPDTMILPLEQYLLINQTQMSVDNNTTILQYFLANNEYISTVAPVLELDGAGTGGLDRFMVYTRDLDHLSFEIPQTIEMLGLEKKGMEYEQKLHTRCGGVIVYYPAAIAYGDGI